MRDEAQPDPARQGVVVKGGAATSAGGLGKGRVVTPCYPVSGDEAERRGVLGSIVMTGVVRGAGALLGCHVMSLSATTAASRPPPPCHSLLRFLRGRACGRPATHVHLYKVYAILKMSCRRRGPGSSGRVGGGQGRAAEGGVVPG